MSSEYKRVRISRYADAYCKDLMWMASSDYCIKISQSDVIIAALRCLCEQAPDTAAWYMEMAASGRFDI